MAKLKIKDYLKYFRRGKQSTKLRNARKLKKFCEWAKKTPDELIAEYKEAKDNNDLDSWERDKTNEILEFYNWFREAINPRTGKKYSINYCNTETSGILAFHHQNTRYLEHIMDTFAPTQMPTNEYRFSQDDLRKMFYYGDTEEKALLSLAVSYGQGSKDFLKLECQTLRDVIEEAKDKGMDFAKWIGEAREKTSIQPVSFLTPEAIESVDEYLQLLEKKHGKLPTYIWCNSKPNRFISNEGLNKRLRRIVSKANIKIGNKKVRFHCLRKFTFSRLRRIDKDMAKIVCAKSVSVSDMTYEEVEEQAEKVFRLAYKNISLNGDVTGQVKQRQAKKIEELENAIITLSKEMRAYKTTSETLTNKLTEQEQKSQELTDYLAELDGALSHHRSKEIREIYENIKAELGIRIENLSKKLDRLMTFVGFKPDKQDKTE